MVERRIYDCHACAIYHRRYSRPVVPEWYHLRNTLQQRILWNGVVTRRLALDIHVNSNGVEVTGFDIEGYKDYDSALQLDMVALGVLQSIRQWSERSDFTVPRLIVRSPNRERIEPLLEREGYTVYHFPMEGNSTGVIGVLKGL